MKFLKYLNQSSFSEELIPKTSSFDTDQDKPVYFFCNNIFQPSYFDVKIFLNA